MKKAIHWFLRAAKQGDKTAQHNLGIHYARLEKQAKAAESEEAEDAEEAEEETEPS